MIKMYKSRRAREGRGETPARRAAGAQGRRDRIVAARDGHSGNEELMKFMSWRASVENIVSDVFKDQSGTNLSQI